MREEIEFNPFIDCPVCKGEGGWYESNWEFETWKPCVRCELRAKRVAVTAIDSLQRSLADKMQRVLRAQDV